MTEREINSKETMALLVAQRTAENGNADKTTLLHLFTACSSVISVPNTRDEKIVINPANQKLLLDNLQHYNLGLHELSGHENLTHDELVATYCTLWAALKFLLDSTPEKVQRPARV